MTTNEDYSHEEIATVCKELLSEHSDKLKEPEVVFVNLMYHKNLCCRVTQENRDTLIAMYDRLKQI